MSIHENIKIEVQDYSDLLEANRVEWEGLKDAAIVIHDKLDANKKEKKRVEKELDRLYKIINELKKNEK